MQPIAPAPQVPPAPHVAGTSPAPESELVLARAIRAAVFTDEQGIPAELDLDGLDEGAVHVLVFDGERAVARDRLVVEPGGVGVLARIAVVAEERGRGVGTLVIDALEGLAAELGLTRLTLHPHLHLESFYSGRGYETVAGSSKAGRHELNTMRKML